MSDVDPTGTGWSRSEIDLIVADYFSMLWLDLAGQPYVKSRHNLALQQTLHRSRGSIEFKHQNISAVLEWLGLPWIKGYLPRANYQRALLDGIERFLDAKPSALAADISQQAGIAEASTFFVEPPPQLAHSDLDVSKHLLRLVRKFDPAVRDARNRELGREGEKRVLAYERARLAAANRLDLSRKVRWVAQEDGDGAGYDILSYDAVGRERLLEVKTTVGGQKTPFFISENERSLSDERPDAFRLVRLYDFRTSARAFELVPPITDSVVLRAAVYRASFL